MRLTFKTHVSFAILMSVSLGLGACAAHKRDNVSAIRAARDKKASQGQTTTTSTDPVTGQPVDTTAQTKPAPTDWKSILSTDNKGTFQLLRYTLQIVKNVEAQTVMADVTLESSPSLHDTALPFTAPKTPVVLTKDKDTKDSDIADVLNKIPKIVNEFSATDGTIVSARQDVLDLQTAASSQYEEAITISQGNGKVSDDSKWSAVKIIVTKLPNGSIEVDRIAALDADKTMLTKEELIYNLQSNPQIVDVNADTKLQTPKIDISAPQI